MTELPSIPVAFSLGANLGDSLTALRVAVQTLVPYVVVTATSPVYKTPPLYITDQPAFLNIAVIGTTKLEPLTLLWTLKDIENKIGRKPNFRYGPREIDIDIVLYGDLIMTTPELTIPHSHMGERDFVLYPLADIAPDWRHPQTGRTIIQMRDALIDRGVICLGRIL